jgi:hypothetical protein
MSSESKIGVSPMIKEVTGIIKMSRSAREDGSTCKCCHGDHAHGRWVEYDFTSTAPSHFPRDADRFIADNFTEDDRNEGNKVRIIAEMVGPDEEFTEMVPRPTHAITRSIYQEGTQVIYTGDEESCKRAYDILIEYHEYESNVSLNMESLVGDGSEQEYIQRVLDDPDFKYGY